MSDDFFLDETHRMAPLKAVVPPVRSNVRREPSVSDNTVPGLDHHFMDESYDLLEDDDEGGELRAEDRQQYAGDVRSGRSQKSRLPILVALVGAGVVGVWLLVSRVIHPSAVVPQAVSLPPVATALQQAPESPSQPQQPLAATTAVGTAGSQSQIAPLANQQSSANQPVPHTSVDQGNMPMPDQVSSVLSERSRAQTSPVKAVADQQLAAPTASVEARKKIPIPVSKEKKPTTPVAVKAHEKPQSKVWKTNPDYFTVQVAAAYSESGVKSVKASLPAIHPSAIHKTTKGGQPWYVLVYGSFPTRQEAAQAKAKLPAAAQKGTQPWVRKQSEIFGH